MSAGDLNSRIVVKRQSKAADNYGGFTSTLSTQATIWGSVKQIKGAIDKQTGRRSRSVEVEIIVRKKAADDINDSDVLVINDESENYVINEMFEHDRNFYTTIKATKTV